MALNSYVIMEIEGAQEKAPSPMLQAIVPFKMGPTTQEIIETAFTLAMDHSEQTIARLILEADVSRQNLDQMDVDITTLHDMLTREDKHTTAEKDRLLSELWTKLGWNGGRVREHDDRLAFLGDLADYRQRARAHVMAATQTLQTMSDDLEELRERVAAPGILGGRVPLQVHIDTIRNGLERLMESRTRARRVRAGTD